VHISPPTNVQLTPLPSQCGVFISWELGESYYGLPYPNISFILQIQYAVNLTEATPRLEVVGKVCSTDYKFVKFITATPHTIDIASYSIQTNVTLQNFSTNNNYSVQVSPY